MNKKTICRIEEKLRSGETVLLETVVKGTEGTVKDGISRSLKDAVPLVNEKGKRCFRVENVCDGETRIIREPITPAERLIIFGGGHVSLPLSRFAADCGFSVVVVDDRPEFATHTRFPHVKEIVCAPYAEAVKKLEINDFDYVVIVTSGHANDGDCVKGILEGIFPAYLGMIGSRRRVRLQFDLMEQEGYSRELLNRIHTPIGLNIGGVTPAEIAVSIIAEVIACKRMPEEEGNRTGCFNESDLEPDLIDRLLTEEGPSALVTLIESRGSTPRKAGAKMLVRADGTITGTIGGGLSEGLAIREAKALIGTGNYVIRDYDLSGDVAKRDGMVCGGFSRVLIEDWTIEREGEH